MIPLGTLYYNVGCPVTGQLVPRPEEQLMHHTVPYKTRNKRHKTNLNPRSVTAVTNLLHDL
eukprot:541911-Amphidinium_carterae.1